MVLIRLRWLCVLACAACSQSLFDAHGGGGGGDDDGGPATCNAPCLADAALDFNGTAGGKGQMWRYLEDHRNRIWAPMTPSSAAMTGVDPANHITTCAANPGAAACAMLPDALLMSSSGSTSAADPAIEFTAPAQGVIQLTLKAFMASGADQTIQLYRNGRPDALFVGVATANKPIEQTITLDALAKDRFLVALEPVGAGASDVAIQFIASSAGMVFPSACLFAVEFASATGNTVGDLCKGATLSYTDDADHPTPVVLGDDPFGQHSTAATVALGTYFKSNQVIPQNTTLTAQLWVRQRAVSPGGEFAWLFSDIDLTDGLPGGLDFGVGTNPTVAVTSTATVSQGSDVETAAAVGPWPGMGDWHFLRVVQTGGNLNLCVDGSQTATVAVPDGHLKTLEPVFLARNKFGMPAGQSYFDGNLDDVRVFKGALPCN